LDGVAPRPVDDFGVGSVGPHSHGAAACGLDLLRRTVARTGEVLCAKHQEIDFDGRRDRASNRVGHSLMITGSSPKAKRARKKVHGLCKPD
jgi:hypothetical protein